jgi:hypothetical protein
MELIKDFLSLLKDYQGIIGIIIGVLITYIISKKERQQKDKFTEGERIDKFRLSAINEKLAAHQKAFEIWYKLSLNIHSENSIDLANEARVFWISNCLYLTPKCRKEFDDLIFEFGMYKINRQIWFDTEERNEKKKKSDVLIEKFNNILAVGKIIQEEVDASYTEPKPISNFKIEENKKLKG